jgi:hypothetical protein
MNVIIIFIIIGLLIWCRCLHKNVELFYPEEEDKITKYIAYLGKYVPEGGTALDFSNVVGIQGPVGPVGDQGPRGGQGYPGSNGHYGDPGEPGLSGIQGERGERGEQGYPGYPGERGQDGATGAKGDTGGNETKGDISRILIDESIGLVNKIEGFTQKDEENISALVYFNTLINTILIDYIGTIPAGATGKDGVKGDIGATGKDGAKGATGAKGIKGDDGFDGASIFDVSKFRLNGDTDLFKKRRKKDDDSDDPQPSTAYTTLFD